jgi:hypothetical protein
MSSSTNIIPTINFGNSQNPLASSANAISESIITPINNSINASIESNQGFGGLLVYLPIILILAVITILVILYSIFSSSIHNFFRQSWEKIRDSLGLKSDTSINSQQSPTAEQQMTGEAPGEILENTLINGSPLSLPQMNGKQVFNVAKNVYTFDDAAPLCRALGAELATYEQVKEAWKQGADWCNYGWIEGQAAVYPTQQQTYDKLQQGPEEQRNACGRVGVNGGYFDNPGLRFGVNCYGIKPSEKNHDKEIITQGINLPQTPEALIFDKKMKKYQAQSDTIGILPFKEGTWSI